MKFPLKVSSTRQNGSVALSKNMRQKNLDRVTTYTGLGASIAGGLAGVGIAPTYTAPIAAVLGGVFSWFTQKPATSQGD